jgi:nucleoside-diphosphate-sugar epimerase
VARRWLAAGDRVYAVTRRAGRLSSWQDEGLCPIVADVTEPTTLGDLPEVFDTVLYAVAHDATSGKSPEATQLVGLRNVLEALPPAFRRMIYISSTGVYGDAHGEWVDEDTPCHPQRPAGQACLDAEKMLEAHRFAGRAVILRLAGIYGPGRAPRQAALLAGEALDAPRHGFLNLIHVDDAVASVIAAAEVPIDLPRRYLISDGCPIEREKYYAELARLIGAPAPRFRSSDGTPAHLRAAADKRIANTRMIAELKLSLRYPDYRSGLAAVVADS